MDKHTSPVSDVSEDAEMTLAERLADYTQTIPDEVEYLLDSLRDLAEKYEDAEEGLSLDEITALRGEIDEAMSPIQSLAEWLDEQEKAIKQPQLHLVKPEE